MSRFGAMKSRRDFLRNRGFRYNGRILIRTTDPNLYKNERLRGYANILERIINEWILQVKRIKTFYNYAVDADSDDIN